MYRELIAKATGATDDKLIGAIEDYMRHSIFNSTLDWQTAAQLTRAAKTALSDFMAQGYFSIFDKETRKFIHIKLNRGA